MVYCIPKEEEDHMCFRLQDNHGSQMDKLKGKTDKKREMKRFHLSLVNIQQRTKWQTESHYKVIFDIYSKLKDSYQNLHRSKGKHILAEGVIPFDQPLDKRNEREDMVLPVVFDTLRTVIGSKSSQICCREEYTDSPLINGHISRSSQITREAQDWPWFHKTWEFT